MYVFKIFIPSTGMSYIGAKTTSPDQSRTYLGSHPQLKEDLKQVSRSTVKKKILYETNDIKELAELELKAIQDHNAVEKPNYYNSTYHTTISTLGVSSGMKGKKHTAKSKKLMRENSYYRSSPTAVLTRTISRVENGLKTTKGYRKVFYKYQSVARINKQDYYFGSYKTAEEAQKVSVKARKLYLTSLKAELKLLNMSLSISKHN